LTRNSNFLEATQEFGSTIRWCYYKKPLPFLAFVKLLPNTSVCHHLTQYWTGYKINHHSISLAMGPYHIATNQYQEAPHDKSRKDFNCKETHKPDLRNSINSHKRCLAIVINVASILQLCTPQSVYFNIVTRPMRNISTGFSR